MSSSWIKWVRGDTALNLTLKFALLFSLSAVILFVTVDSLLSRAQQGKDQQLIASFLESYQRLERSAGEHKLQLVIERDAPYFQRTEMWVELRDDAGKRLLEVRPDAWGSLTLPLFNDLSDGGWVETVLPAGDLALIVGQIKLSQGQRLRIGRSLAHRKAELQGYRQIVLGVLLPLFGLGLLLSYYMNWCALRQVKDLIETVRQLRATDLNARVTVRNPHSELGELAQLFNTMLAQIERLIIGMQHSLDAVAHDLRTPLARMRLSIESAVAEADADTLREALLDCAEEGARIETMLKTLMDISEAESGILALRPEPIDLDARLNDCLELYRYAAEERSISLETEFVSPLRIQADSVRLQQVFGNLIDNAIKYGKRDGWVRVSAQDMGAQVRVEIEDDGIGIESAAQSRVFERLYRADRSRGTTGMGLGLSLVKAIVEAHHGRIELTSVPGQGSKVSLWLPKTVDGLG